MRKLRPATTFPLPCWRRRSGRRIAIAVAIPFVVPVGLHEPVHDGHRLRRRARLARAAAVDVGTDLAVPDGLCRRRGDRRSATPWVRDGPGWPPWPRAIGVAWSPAAVRRHPFLPALSGVYLAVATFGFGLLAPEPALSDLPHVRPGRQRRRRRGRICSASTPRRTGRTTSWPWSSPRCAPLIVVGVRRSRLGRLLRGLSDSPAALEAHGANTRLTRLYVFCISAGIAAVGGVLIGGVTQTGGRHARRSVRLLQLRRAARRARLLREPASAVAGHRCLRLRGGPGVPTLQRRVVHQLRRRLLRLGRHRGRGRARHAPCAAEPARRRASRPEPGGEPGSGDVDRRGTAVPVPSLQGSPS